MKSPKPLATNISGITLLEMLMSIAILTILLAIAVPVGLDFYLDYQLDSETRLLSSALQYTRNLSLVNNNEADHGIHINSANLVIFQGSSFAARDATQDKTFPRVSSITISGATDLVFSVLSGQAASTTVSVTDSRKTRNVYVNPEGLVY